MFLVFEALGGAMAERPPGDQGASANCGFESHETQLQRDSFEASSVPRYTDCIAILNRPRPNEQRV